MTRLSLRSMAAAALLLVVAGCSSTSAPSSSSNQQNSPAPAAQPQPAPAGATAAPAAPGGTTSDAGLHNHGAASSKLGLSTGVVDNLMEATDVSQLSADGKSLVAVDLPNALDLMHGSLMIIKDQVMIYLNGKSVVWSEKPSDLPANGNIVAPVTYNNNRLRMPADLLAQLMEKAGMKDGKLEVKDGKLYITTGR